MPLDIQNLVSSAMRRQVSLSEFSQPVYIEDAQAVDELVSLTVRTRDGQTIQTIVPAAELAAALEQATAQSTTGTLASPLDFFLLVEAARIRLAYSFDPFFAVSMSGVQALPHQLQAVYERMLPQARLRFLLADDPGAGKTIMAGLLLKELKLRGVVTYVLILTPAPLTIQWQDELYSKFDETFEIVYSDMVGNQLAGNVWERYRQCIASLDFAKQERITQNLEQIPWDLIIIDEAHKCSAHTQGEKVAKTRRYQLAERLSAGAERILLLTATPHSGDPDQFAHFLRLLDADQFPDPRYDGLQLDRKILEDARAGGRDQWFLRRIKEELRDRAGNPLFTKRHVSTVPFKLTWPEEQLYKHVTEYINLFLPYQQGGGARRNSVALARTVLQRRLASSLHAIHRSLERRANHFRDILQELERLPANEHEKVLYRYRLLASSGYEDEESDSGDLDEQQEEAMENFPVMQRVDQLRVEVQALEKLVQEAARERGYQMVALIAEQASGLDEKRTGLKQLLHLIDHQEIDLVLIEYPDRLVRFGFSYLEETFRWKHVRIEVVESPKVQTPTEELVADLLSSVTVFSGRIDGSRAKKIRPCVSHALKDCLKAAEADGTNRQNNQTLA